SLKQLPEPYRAGVCPLHICYQRPDVTAEYAVATDWYVTPPDELMYELQQQFAAQAVELESYWQTGAIISLKFLDFEQPIAELQAQIDELKAVGEKGDFDISLEEEITKLQEKREQLVEKIFGNLGAWQVAQLARHPLRPYTLDY